MTMNWKIVIDVCVILSGIVAGAYILRALYRFLASIIGTPKKLAELEEQTKRIIQWLESEFGKDWNGKDRK